MARVKHMQPVTTGQCRGVTLLELILVLLLIGILAVYAATRWSQEAASVAPQGARLASDIRHLQILAMTQGQRYTLHIPVTNDRYQVRDILNNVITDPVTGAPFTVVLATNTVIAGVDTGFDGLGRPLNGAVLAAAPRSCTLTAGGQTSVVTIAPVSGFVTVTP